MSVTVLAVAFSGAIALVIAAFTAYLTQAPIRARCDELERRLKMTEKDLDLCLRARADLQRRLELVTAAIIATLAASDRVKLLNALHEQPLAEEES